MQYVMGCPKSRLEWCWSPAWFQLWIINKGDIQQLNEICPLWNKKPRSFSGNMSEKGRRTGWQKRKTKNLKEDPQNLLMWPLHLGEKGRWRSLDRHIHPIPSWQCLASSHSAHLNCKLSERQFLSYLVITPTFNIRFQKCAVKRLLTRHRGTGLLPWTRCPLTDNCHPPLPWAARSHSLSWTEGRGSKANPWGTLVFLKSRPKSRDGSEEKSGDNWPKHLVLLWLVAVR